ncbi:phage tail tip lysozyme [Methylobacterium durans]|nr:phage tail tip lysozyme [Methylobacterium durans]
MRRAEVAMQLFGSRSFAILGSEGPAALRRYVQEAERDLGKLPRSAEDTALAFERNLTRFRDSLRGLRDEIGVQALPALRDFTTGVRDFINANREEIGTGVATGLRELAQAARDFPYKDVGDGLMWFFRETGTAAKSFAEGIKAAKEAIDLFRDGKIIEGLKRLDGATDMGLGRRSGAPASRAPSALDEALDAQIRGQSAGGAKASDLEARLQAAQKDLDYQQRRFPVRDETAIRNLNREIGQLTEELRKLRENGGATVQQQSFNDAVPFGGARILRASLGGGGFGGGAGFGGSAGGFGRPGGLPPTVGGGSDAGERLRQGSGSPDTGRRLKSEGGVPAGVNARAMRAMGRLIGHGWKPEAAASAIGQAMEESSVRSDGPLGDTARFGFGDDAAHGMFQWRAERFRALKAFAAKRGKAWTDFDTQVDFFNEETSRRRNPAERNWRNETDLGRGNLIGRSFEGYSGPLQPQREAHARRFLREWNRGAYSIPREEVATGADGQGFDASRRFLGNKTEPGDLRMSYDRSADILRRAVRDGMVGKNTQAITGDFGIKIDSTGAPGVKVKAPTNDLFNRVELRRGRSMALASEDA